MEMITEDGLAIPNRARRSRSTGLRQIQVDADLRAALVLIDDGGEDTHAHDLSQKNAPRFGQARGEIVIRFVA